MVPSKNQNEAQDGPSNHEYKVIENSYSPIVFVSFYENVNSASHDIIFTVVFWESVVQDWDAYNASYKCN